MQHADEIDGSSNYVADASDTMEEIRVGGVLCQSYRDDDYVSWKNRLFELGLANSGKKRQLLRKNAILFVPLSHEHRSALKNRLTEKNSREEGISREMSGQARFIGVYTLFGNNTVRMIFENPVNPQKGWPMGD